VKKIANLALVSSAKTDTKPLKCQSQEFALWFLKISVMRHACDEKIAESITEQVRKSNLPEKITESDRVAAQSLGVQLVAELGASASFPISIPISPE